MKQLDFKNPNEVADFIAKNKGKNTKTKDYILSVPGNRLKLRLSDGKEFLFNKYGKLIFTDVLIYDGTRSEQLYHLEAKYGSMKNLDIAGKATFRKIAEELYEEVKDIYGYEAPITIQRKSYHKLEVYMLKNNSMLSINTETGESIADGALMDIAMALKIGEWTSEDYKNLVRELCMGSVSMKIKSYQRSIKEINI